MNQQEALRDGVMLSISFDDGFATLYVGAGAHPVHRTVELVEHVMADVDELGNLIGIEVLWLFPPGTRSVEALKAPDISAIRRRLDELFGSGSKDVASQLEAAARLLPPAAPAAP